MQTTVTQKFFTALVDFSYTFLPLIAMMVLCFCLGKYNDVQQEVAWFSAALFSEGAWRARRLRPKTPSDTSALVLLGVLGCVFLFITALLLTLADWQVFSPDYHFGVRAAALRISAWGFALAVLYSLVVRFQTPD
jgi:hypothetical protein